ncbi:MAG TPA: DUF2330 domain-containing protein [Candidatus Dormibacteraeota bacterium]|nr:DUF2330 domain-containing protein [Candidatus Dormibacteraeota bacterium]
MIRRIRLWLAIPVAAFALTLGASPALACGALVAPNGSVRLGQTTSFVSWQGGLEHYLTSFSFQGTARDLGWIVPLPARPLRVQEGGAWTLQRLELQVHPAPKISFSGLAAAAPSRRAQVLLKTQIAALDITVIRGSGPAVLNWCHGNGFTLASEVRAHLLRYAAGSPYFMAARYNLTSAHRHKLNQGDGTPVLLTFRVPQLWVPLEVLADDALPVRADLFLLTDGPLTVATPLGDRVQPVGDALAGAPGFLVANSQPMSPSLHEALSTDRHMGWVPSRGWLTYLTLRAPGAAVTYDLAVSPANQLRLVPFGTRPDLAATTAATVTFSNPAQGAASAAALLVLLGLTLVTALLWRVGARTGS